jgi:recombination protein RecT
VRQQLKALEPAIGRAVPTGLKPDRFLRVVLTELSKNPRLETCTPTTVLGAVMTAAQLGLEFGPLGHAYLVPYKNRCTLIIGYKGFIDLARRSGQLRSIVARPVHANDYFDFQLGTDEHLTHRPAIADAGPVVAYYGIARLADGDPIITVMSPADVDRYRARAMASDDGPWVTDYDAMACKTVVRRMVPWLPLSVEAAQAVEADEKVIEWNGEAVSIVEPDGAAADAADLDDGPAADAIEATSSDAPPAAEAPDGAPQMFNDESERL